MGWGTSFDTEIYLNKLTFDSYYELEDKIEELEESIIETKKSIYMYSMSNPSEIIPDDWKEDSVMFIKMKMNELIEIYEEEFLLLQKLYIFKKHIDENKLNIKDFNPFKNDKDE